MKDKIIETAGKAWSYLGKNGQTEISKVAKGLKEKNEVVYQALGWLAREDKLQYETINNKTLISLTDTELQFAQAILEKLNTNESQPAEAKARRKAGRAAVSA